MNMANKKMTQSRGEMLSWSHMGQVMENLDSLVSFIMRSFKSKVFSALMNVCIFVFDSKISGK